MTCDDCEHSCPFYREDTGGLRCMRHRLILRNSNWAGFDDTGRADKCPEYEEKE